MFLTLNIKKLCRPRDPGALLPRPLPQPSAIDLRFQSSNSSFKEMISNREEKLRKTPTFLFLDPDLLPFLLKRLHIFKIAPWPAENEFLKQVKYNF